MATGTTEDDETDLRRVKILPVGVFETDGQGNCVFVNDRWCELAGMTSDAAKGLGWVGALHPDDRERVFTEWYDAARTGREFRSEYRFRTPHGRVTWLHGTGLALRDGRGQVTGYLGTITDIDSRKRAEAAIRESEERLRATFDQAAVGVAHVGLDSRTRWVNPGLCEMLGYSEAELLARTFIELTHPDDLDADLSLRKRLLDGDIPSYRIEKRYLHRDGSIVWGDVALSLVRDTDERPTHAVAVVVDVTARKRAEARLEAVLATIDDHLVSYDRQWRYTFVNDAAAHLLGKRKEELLGKSIWELFPDAVGNQYYRELHEALAEQRAIRSEHYYAPYEKWFENYIYPSPEGVTAFSVDVTWRKRLEEELQRQNERLAEADRHKDQFLAMLAHELRNPLAPLRSALQVMRVAAGDQAVVAQVREVAERQVHNMARLLDDLLDVSRISRGRIVLDCEVVDVRTIVERTVEAMRPLIEEHHHQLRVSLPAEPLRVDADATRIEQVLANLLNNAAKYTSPGGTIWLTAEAAGGEVVLRVRDTGIGIPADALPRIFDLFVRSERRADRSQGGVGIGLTLVKQLIELHQGRVEARSDGPGKGSEFIVCLPAVAGTPRDMPDAARHNGAVRSVPRRRILLADDNQDAADSLALLLELSGQDVRTAYDGPTALARAAEFQPAVVLLDIGMPGMDGYEVARRLRSDASLGRCTLIALTGWGQDEDRRRAAAAGFDYHLTKPVEIEALQELLAKS